MLKKINDERNWLINFDGIIFNNDFSIIKYLLKRKEKYTDFHLNVLDTLSDDALLFYLENRNRKDLLGVVTKEVYNYVLFNNLDINEEDKEYLNRIEAEKSKRPFNQIEQPLLIHLKYRLFTAMKRKRRHFSLRTPTCPPWLTSPEQHRHLSLS